MFPLYKSIIMPSNKSEQLRKYDINKMCKWKIFLTRTVTKRQQRRVSEWCSERKLFEIKRFRVHTLISESFDFVRHIFKGLSALRREKKIPIPLLTFVYCGFSCNTPVEGRIHFHITYWSASAATKKIKSTFGSSYIPFLILADVVDELFDLIRGYILKEMNCHNKLLYIGSPYCVS